MDEQGKQKVICLCPYCEVTIEPESAICIACRMVIIECESCGKQMREDADACPSCGNATDAKREEPE